MTIPNQDNTLLTIEYFEAMAKTYKNKLNIRSTVIDMISVFVPHCKAAGTSQEIIAPYLQAQIASGAQGACFLHREDIQLDDLKGFVGMPVLDVVPKASHCVKIALIDAIYGEINKIEKIHPVDTFEFSGTYSEKSLDRARKIIELTEIRHSDKVAIVGVVHDIVKEVIEIGADVRLSDFGQMGTNILGIPISNNSTALVEWADIAIVTGNILKTRTVWNILSTAQRYSTKLTLFSMTGSNIAPRYLRYGANVVTVEEFPYYWFSGIKSQMKIYK